MMGPRAGFLGWVAAPLLSMLLFVSIAYVPVMGSLLNPFAPLPIIYYSFTHGVSAGGAAVFAVAGLIGMLMGPMAGAFYLVAYGLTGLMMANMIRRERSMTATVFYTAGAALAGSALLAALTAGTGLAGLYAESLATVGKMLTDTIAAYEKAGMPAEQLSLLKENASTIALWLVRILPGLFAVLYLSAMFMNYAAYAVLRKRWSWLPETQTVDLARWSPPEKTVFVFIIGGALALVPADAARIAGINLLIVTNALYFMAGMCVIQYWFDRTRFPRFLRWAIYILILLQPFMIAGTAGLGLFDLWLDFRKIRRAKGEKEDTNGSDS